MARHAILSTWTFLFACICIFAGPVVSAAADNQRILWEKGKQAYKRHDYKACVNYATALLKLHPEPAWQIYFGRGAAYAELGQHDEAIADFNEVLRANSQFVSAYIDRGLSYMRKGLFQQALSDFNQAIRIDPRNARAYRDRADVEDELYLSDEALRDYDTALRYNPLYEPALYNRGNHHAFTRHDDTRAIADYTKCLRLNPADTAARHNRAGCYRRQGQTKRAIADFGDIIRQNPQDVCAYVARAEGYLKQNDRIAAIEDAKRAIDLVPKDAEDFRCRASAAVLLGQYGAASRDLSEACHHDPSSIRYLNSLAWLLATCPDSGVRDGKEAVTLSRKACMTTGWRAAGCIDTLAAAYAETGDFEQALKYEEMALSKKKSKKAELRLKLFRDRKPYRSEREIDVDTDSDNFNQEVEKRVTSIR